MPDGGGDIGGILEVYRDYDHHTQGAYKAYLHQSLEPRIRFSLQGPYASEDETRLKFCFRVCGSGFLGH